MNIFLEKDTRGNWNTIPAVPAEKIKNVNCHKFVLYEIKKISYTELISDPLKQKSQGEDFTYGEKIRFVTDEPYTLIKDEKDLELLIRNCEVGKIYVGQILDATTQEMAHSFLMKREINGNFTCFDKPGFKYPFAICDINTILNFTNKDGECSNRNQKWRFVSVESIK